MENSTQMIKINTVKQDFVENEEKTKNQDFKRLLEKVSGEEMSKKIFLACFIIFIYLLITNSNDIMLKFKGKKGKGKERKKLVFTLWYHYARMPVTFTFLFTLDQYIKEE